MREMRFSHSPLICSTDFENETNTEEYINKKVVKRNSEYH